MTGGDTQRKLGLARVLNCGRGWGIVMSQGPPALHHVSTLLTETNPVDLALTGAGKGCGMHWPGCSARP